MVEILEGPGHPLLALGAHRVGIVEARHVDDVAPTTPQRFGPTFSGPPLSKVWQVLHFAGLVGAVLDAGGLQPVGDRQQPQAPSGRRLAARAGSATAMT